MTALSAILLLFSEGKITEEKAYELGNKKNVDIDVLTEEIERIKNPPVEDTDDESTQDIPIE